MINRAHLRMNFYARAISFGALPLQWASQAPLRPGAASDPGAVQDLRPQLRYYPYAFGTADYSTLTEWPNGRSGGAYTVRTATRWIPGT